MTTRQMFKEIKFLKDNGAHKGGLKPLYDRDVRLLRKRLKESDYWGLDNEIVVKQCDDCAIIRIPIGQYPDRDTAELFAEFLRRKYVPTPYDCTGQLFTRWQEVHYMAGEYWLWQCNCLDV